MPNCSHCGESNPERARYCMGCGSPLAALARSEEIRRVTVLFADIVSSTALIAGSDPEDAPALLDGVLRQLRGAVREFGGSVIGVAGDGIKVLFGAPVALEDHARRACASALQMQTLLAGEQARGAPVRVRIGINSGNVLLRAVASDLHVEYSAEGETTHLAAKAQQLAEPGGIVVAAEVARLVGGFFELRPRSPLRLPGLPEPVPLFELVRATDMQSRFQVAVRKGLSPFVGRLTDLEALRAVAAAAKRDGPVAVGVVGEAGIGKSRLMWEFRQGLPSAQWRVVVAPATQNGTPVAFHPWVSALRALHAIGSDGGSASVRRRLEAVSPSLDIVPLLPLLDLPPDAGAWARLDAAQRIERTQQALVAGLIAGCGGRPTLIVIDDLHEADAESRRLIEVLLTGIKGVPLLLLLGYRPGDSERLEQLPRFTSHPLETLDDGAASALFRQLAGADAALAPLERRVLAQVAGNPFFIEEGVRMLKESASRVDLPIPGSVVDVIETRIARLAAPEREVLQNAAVVGRRIHLPILAGLTGLDPMSLAGKLAQLVEAGLLVRFGDDPAADFAFKHAVTQEVAYRIATKATRQAMHARVVELLEAQPASALPERVELLAHHTLGAQAWERALGYLEQAARRATERSAMREAVRLLERGVAVVHEAKALENPVDREVGLHLAMRGPLLAMGDIRGVGRVVTRLVELQPTCIDPGRRGRVAVVVAGHRWLTGRHAAAVEAGRIALALGRERDDESMLIPARQSVGGALHELGQFEEAEALLTENVRTVPLDAPGHAFGMAGWPAVLCRSMRGWLHEHLGRFAEGEADAAEALRIAEAAAHLFSIMSATFTLVSLDLARARFAPARERLTGALALCRANRQHLWLPVVGSMLALANASLGERDEAARLIDATVPDPANEAITTYMAVTIAQAYAAIGRHEAAASLAAATRERARSQGERLWEVEALLLLAQLADVAARRPEADAAYHEALGQAERLGMRGLAARCRLGLARLAGRREEIDAPGRLAEAEAELRTLGLGAWIGHAGAGHDPLRSDSVR